MTTPNTNRRTARTSWVAYPRPNPQARLRLFCFPYSGASDAIFATWGNDLPAAVEVCPVRLPGRGPRLAEQPFRRLAPLVEALGQALTSHLDRPFAFFGHSMGALVAFELARHLRRTRRVSPVRLFASGHRAPHLPDRDAPIHDLPEPEFIAELRRYNGTPAEVLEHTELRQLVVPILRADFEVCETYAYQDDAPLDCPISVYGGTHDEQIHEDELQAWRLHTRAAFSLSMFSGDHFFITTNRQQLLQTLAHDLVRSQREG